MNIPQRLTALREQMQQAGISAYIVPGTDPHNSEYMASHWAEMQWISGFQGETGTAVITRDKALLWTDSRYYLQAEQELRDTTVQLMRESDIDCPTIAQWLQKNVQGTVAVNAEMYTVNAFQQLKESIGSLPLTTCDLIRPIWTDNRPDIPMNPLYIYDDIYEYSFHSDSKLGHMDTTFKIKLVNYKSVNPDYASDEVELTMEPGGSGSGWYSFSCAFDGHLFELVVSTWPWGIQPRDGEWSFFLTY